MMSLISAMPTVNSRGIDPKIFLGRLPQKYFCAKCRLVLRDPRQSYCGHRFCEGCMRTFLTVDGQNAKCPQCVEDEAENSFTSLSPRNMFPDRAIWRDMAKLRTRCIAEGCTWTGTLEIYLTHEKDCQYIVEICPFGCNESVLRREMATHFVIAAVRHIDILRQQITQLLEKTGAAQSSFPEPQLEERVSRLESNIKELNDSVVVITRRKSQQITQHGEATGEFTAQGSLTSASGNHGEDQLAGLEFKNQITADLTHVLRTEVAKLTRTWETMETQLTQKTEQLSLLQSKVANLERNVALKDIAIVENNIRIEALEHTTHDGVLIWPIKEFQHKMEEASQGISMSSYSPPFYTDRAGYKLCCRFYPNGDGVGKGSHMSLFLVILRGPYDGILQWPFSRHVTMKLLDQTGRGEDVTAEFKPDSASNSFRKPVADMNIASGVPTFVSHALLNKKRTTYVKDDTLFIKIIIGR